jgi:sulfate adenylyltransferase subunit 1 (EFTu-like GTPase family)
VWMDERPLDPDRLYVVKHNTRSVTAQLERALVLNEIGTLAVSAAQPLVFDPYGENRTTGSFVVIDPATNFTAGAGMIVRALEDGRSSATASAALRIAAAARAAANDRDASEAVQRLLEEMLT